MTELVAPDPDGGKSRRPATFDYRAGLGQNPFSRLKVSCASQGASGHETARKLLAGS
jgi:hypothetical protein